jgi:sugar lactone lactonase YvrE
MFLLVCFVNCDGQFIEEEQKVVVPPDANKATEITSYFPDSGGAATKMILYGSNFGTDTSYIKVTVNGKNARVIGSDGTSILAIVPARADTGLVSVHIGKGNDVKTLSYTSEFKYQFKRAVTTLAGQKGQSGEVDGTYTTCKLKRPWEIVSDKDGVLYYLDEGRGLKNTDGGLRRVYDGQVTAIMRNSGGPMQSPTALCFNTAQDTLYLLNSLWNANDMNTDAAVAMLPREANFSIIKPFARARYTRATGLAVHPKTGEVFYNSQVDGYIYKHNSTTGAEEQLFQLNGTDTELRMKFHPDGHTLFIMVKNKHCIYKADYDDTTRKLKNYRLWVGQWGSAGFMDGIGTGAMLDQPGGADVDEDGNLYVADKYNHCIRKITPEGEVSLYAGTARSAGYADGEPSESKFDQPESLCFAPDGAMYVADRNNHLIRRVMVE